MSGRGGRGGAVAVEVAGEKGDNSEVSEGEGHFWGDAVMVK